MNPLCQRREFLRIGALGSMFTLGQYLQLSGADRVTASRGRSAILVFLKGGPSHLDTFDMKPDHENGGEFKPIKTASPGLQISEHFPKIAKLGKELAVIRSLSTKEGDHGRGTYLMRTGHQPGGPIQYPTLGSLISKKAT